MIPNSTQDASEDAAPGGSNLGYGENSSPQLPKNTQPSFAARVKDRKYRAVSTRKRRHEQQWQESDSIVAQKTCCIFDSLDMRLPPGAGLDDTRQLMTDMTSTRHDDNLPGGV